MKISSLFASCALAISAAFAASPDAAKTRQLIGVVQSNAELADRARALQQLALVATPDAVPLLAGLLGDEHLGQYARDGLERMPDAAAGADASEGAFAFQLLLVFEAAGRVMSSCILSSFQVP